MKNKNIIISIKTALFLCLMAIMINSCSKENGPELSGTPRLFRPVLLGNKLVASANNVIANFAPVKGVVKYKAEISRDTFKTIEATIETANNIITFDDLLYNKAYQVRGQAFASDPALDSKVADFGGIKTDPFPTIMNTPDRFQDVTDVGARVSWTVQGEAVTGIKVFAIDDEKLKNPLFPTTAVDELGQTTGEGFVYGLEPETTYQIAIYSGTNLRGWLNFTTKAPDVDPNAAGVIDLTNNDNIDALVDAYATANDGDIILLKFGASYNPIRTFDKSVTIQGELGFGDRKAVILVTGSANWPSGSNIDHIRYNNVNLLSNSNGGYVLYPGNNDTNVNEISFTDCYIYNVRGVLKSKGDNDVINNFNIDRCYVDWSGGYGVAYTDGKSGQMIKNISYTNTTFNHCEYLFYLRNDAENVLVDGCTIVNQKNSLFRLRDVDVTNSWTITNNIIGHRNDPANSLDFLNGSTAMSITAFGNYTVTDLVWNDETEVPSGFTDAGSSQADLWVDPDAGSEYVAPTEADPYGNGFLGDFHFKTKGFPGQYDAGALRWRNIF